MSSHFLTKTIKAKIFIKLPSEIIDVILEALKPEAEIPLYERSRVCLFKTRDGIRIESTANDTTALRASLNSYLRWIQGILNIMDNLF
jgi:KEOPS complex subunit Pcc1